MLRSLYLGNARDDIWVFGGVVFLVAAEYSNLAALQDVNLGGESKQTNEQQIHVHRCVVSYLDCVRTDEDRMKNTDSDVTPGSYFNTEYLTRLEVGQ